MNPSYITQEVEIPEHYGRLVSLSLPCPDVTLSGFLAQAKGQPRFYWESSRDHVAFAAFGKALEIMAWGQDRLDKVQQQASALFKTSVILDEQESLAAPRLFGGFSFRDDFVPDNAWAEFTPAHFVLPHYQLVSINEQTWLTINTHIPFDEDPQTLKSELHMALSERIQRLRDAVSHQTLADHNSPVAVNYPMPYETWADMINAVVQRENTSELNKVVLSRVAEVQFSSRVDVDQALRYLANHYAECYRFLFEPRPYHAFYGATPELLAKVTGSTVRTMALAGSIKRGKTQKDDDALAQQLLTDPKERFEHRIVVEKVKERLTPLTTELHVSETGIYPLSNIQHLYTPIEGMLKQTSGVIPVVKTLHPTPALGGDPRDLAMQVIRDAEPVPRGWYAAPVGWIDRNLDGQFTVAIRSAVAQEKRVWMYAGAGIVAESVPQKEWDETALKFRPMLDALASKDNVDV